MALHKKFQRLMKNLNYEDNTPELKIDQTFCNISISQLSRSTVCDIKLLHGAEMQ